MTPIIDIHCHIYPEKIARKASAGIGDFYDGIEIRHVGSLNELHESSRRCGITHNVIFSVATSPKQVPSINRFIADEVEASDGSFIGLGALHPDTTDVNAVLDQIEDLGLKGVKLHPDIHKTPADDPRYMAIYEACQDRMPILIHCGDFRFDYSNPDRFVKVLKNFPKLQLIGAHFGGWSVWEEAAEKLHGFDNLMVDSSSTFDFGVAPEVSEKLIRTYGADKVMFASDFPAGDGKFDLDYFFKLNLSAEEQEKILYRNAAGYFGIKL